MRLYRALPYFKTFEAMNLNGNFLGWDPVVRDEFVKRSSRFDLRVRSISNQGSQFLANIIEALSKAELHVAWIYTVFFGL
jgi:hypothetical protein